MQTAHDHAAHLADLLRSEHTAMADFLVALADFDRQGLYRHLNHANLFTFLRVGLKLSTGAAHYRKVAAELIQAFPEVERALRDGRLCLSSVAQVAKVLTPENCAEVLPRFFYLSARDAHAVAVSIRPVANPPERDLIVAVRSSPRMVAPPAAPEPAPAPAEPQDATGPLQEGSLFIESAPPSPPAKPAETEPDRATSGAAAAASAPTTEPTGRGPVAHEHAPGASGATAASPPAAAPPPPPGASIVPLDAGHARLHATVSRRFLEKLESAKLELSHARPNATLEEVLETALDALLEQRAKRKGLGVTPRGTPRPAKPGTITADVTRALMARSGGRCEWRYASGERCSSRVRVERDHVIPEARGGPATLENMRLLCRGHNDLAARQAFGDAWMNRFTGKRARRRDRR